MSVEQRLIALQDQDRRARVLEAIISDSGRELELPPQVHQALDQLVDTYLVERFQRRALVVGDASSAAKKTHPEALKRVSKKARAGTLVALCHTNQEGRLKLGSKRYRLGADRAPFLVLGENEHHVFYDLSGCRTEPCSDAHLSRRMNLTKDIASIVDAYEGFPYGEYKRQALSRLESAWKTYGYIGQTGMTLFIAGQIPLRVANGRVVFRLLYDDGPVDYIHVGKEHEGALCTLAFRGPYFLVRKGGRVIAAQERDSPFAARRGYRERAEGCLHAFAHLAPWSGRGHADFHACKRNFSLDRRRLKERVKNLEEYPRKALLAYIDEFRSSKQCYLLLANEDVRMSIQVTDCMIR